MEYQLVFMYTKCAGTPRNRRAVVSIHQMGIVVSRKSEMRFLLAVVHRFACCRCIVPYSRILCYIADKGAAILPLCLLFFLTFFPFTFFSRVTISSSVNGFSYFLRRLLFGLP